MRQAISLGFLSLLGVVSAFLVQWYIFTSLGAGVVTDALFAGMTLPQLALVIVSGSLVHVLVPLLAGESPDKMRRDAWAFFWLVGGLFVVLAIVFGVTASVWVPLMVPGFDDAGRGMAVDFTRIQLIGMVFTAVNGVQWAAYHARRSFVWVELAPVIGGVASIVGLYFLLPRMGGVAAAWVGVARAVLQFLLLLPGMGRPSFAVRHSATVREAWGRVRPLLLGTMYYKTDPMVERYLLSSSAAGSLSLFYLAQQLYGAGSQVLNRAIASPLVPVLSSLHKERLVDEFGSVWRRRMVQIVGLSVLLLVGFALLGRPALWLLVGWGRLGGAEVDGLWNVMMWLGLSFVAGTAGSVSSVAFYAVGDTRTPTRLGVVTYTIYVPLKIGAYSFFGVRGLAMATGLFVFVNLVLQVVMMERGYLRGRVGAS
jgi:putative peptidoglycan lipid II flippase